MKKIVKLLISLILICIVLNIILLRYIDEKSDISKRIGSKWTGGQLSTYNYLAIRNNFEYYISYLTNEDYETAYKYAPYTYKAYKSYEEFLEDIKNISFEDVQVTDIIRKTQRLYTINFNTKNKEELEFIMIFNEENDAFSVTPGTFLEYKELNQKIKKKNVEYKLIDTTNYLDKYIANIEITNNSKKDTVNILEINLRQNDVKKVKGNISNIEIQPNESQNITVTFETDIYFPNKIEISRHIEKNDKEEKYVFNIEEE